MPKSASFTLIWRRSMARIVSFLMGTSKWRPVRLSVMESVSRCAPEGASLTAAGSDLVGFIAQPLQTESRRAGRLVRELIIYTKCARERKNNRGKVAVWSKVNFHTQAYGGGMRGKRGICGDRASVPAGMQIRYLASIDPPDSEPTSD